MIDLPNTTAVCPATDCRTHWLSMMLVILMACFVASSASAEGSTEGLPANSVVNVAVGQGHLLRFNIPVEAVLIADTTIADLQVVTGDIVYVYGLKPGVTNLIALTGDKKVEATALLRVTMDAAPANEANRELNSTGTTELAIFGTRIVAMGHAANMDEAVDVDSVARTFSPPDQEPLNDTTIQGSQQVNIRVRFAEVSRSELQSYGIDWTIGYQSSGFEFGMLQNNAFPDSAGGNFKAGLAHDTGFNFEVVIDALKKNGVLKILAEPNLTAATGQTASFLAGGEIPIPIPQSQDTVTAEYKPFGVSLNFTPTIIGNNRIGLHVKPEVSTPSVSGTSLTVGGFNLPSFVVRRVDTTVEVASGQTFAIAGLFQQTFSRDLDKVPVAGDIPVLGALFRSERFRKEETELVVLITPYLVEPVRHDLATPIDRPAKKRKAGPKLRNTGLIVK
ncbi:type II and III secretion system protein family protein [Pseudaminobacter sp. 19-2017]|uniref:Type II and III secretion system protein family protein n=1 Tax=Pseudaminobacter soli (ex Zhang et al. 2022) TaxID=2831468 RepID=A0A942I6D0_9HYPH|nr:type II and III secretion system protein family protein [Pseudaminobacter soli]MBS3647180.1 type II and III secretion system protein family protein [Pseudaminobacter soli]